MIDIYPIRDAIIEQRHFMEMQGGKPKWIILDRAEATDLFFHLTEDGNIGAQTSLEAVLGGGGILSLLGLLVAVPADDFPLPLTVVNENGIGRELGENLKTIINEGE